MKVRSDFKFSVRFSEISIERFAIIVISHGNGGYGFYIVAKLKRLFNP